MLRTTATIALCLLTTPAAFAATGTAWVASNDIQVVDLAEGRVVAEMALGQHVLDMAFSPDGARGFVGAADGLHVMDAESHTELQHLGDSVAVSIDVDEQNNRLWVLFTADAEACRTSVRETGSWLPNRMRGYDLTTMEQVAAFEVAPRALRTSVSADGSRIFVLDIEQGEVDTYDTTGNLVGSVSVLPEGAAPGSYRLTDMAIAPDGSRLAVSMTGATDAWIAHVDAREFTQTKVEQQDLGSPYRVNAVAFSSDSSSVYASGVQTLVKVDSADQPVTWQGYPTHIQDVARVPGTNELLLLTPTFDRAARTGGLVITDEDGLVQSHVEFPEMSPSTVRVRPSSR